MNASPRIYEFPLNERMRIFMRLEQLFIEVSHFIDQPAIWDSRAAVAGLLDIVSIFSRNDLKSEILKELERHVNVLGRQARSGQVDASQSSAVIAQLSSLSEELYHTTGKIGLSLLEDELFKSISQRSAIPGGTYVFDLPAYYYWLEQDGEARRQALQEWMRPLQNIYQAIRLLMGCIRESGMTTDEVAQTGFFQKNLDHAQPLQLLQVSLQRNLPCFAEISGGKHRFTVRFMSAQSMGVRPGQIEDDVPFRLTCCLL